MELTKRASKYLNSNKLLNLNEPILSAISGGVDSMVLIHILLDLNYKVAVAHCNFSLRGKESDSDEKFVEDFAKKRNLTFHVKKFDTVSYSKSNQGSIQMAARELRYQWFKETNERVQL